jgi:hypothetical protein
MPSQREALSLSLLYKKEELPPFSATIFRQPSLIPLIPITNPERAAPTWARITLLCRLLPSSAAANCASRNRASSRSVPSVNPQSTPPPPHMGTRRPRLRLSQQPLRLHQPSLCHLLASPPPPQPKLPLRSRRWCTRFSHRLPSRSSSHSWWSSSRLALLLRASCDPAFSRSHSLQRSDPIGLLDSGSPHLDLSFQGCGRGWSWFGAGVVE